MDRAQILAAVESSRCAGICVVPPVQNGDKRPDADTWRQYQTRHSTKSEIDRWYTNGRTGIGWVCGAVSGGLEVLDFDDRATWIEYQNLAERFGLGTLLERLKLGYLEHSPNGAHLPYFCSDIDGNTKLAKKNPQKALIETRGEGGYIIVAPTYGGVNKGGAYVMVSGSVETIATITPQERKELHDLARVFDQTPVQEYATHDTYRSPRQGASSDRPGDDFNARRSWADVLRPHGWQFLYERMGVCIWRRPGKKHGQSATTNYQGSGGLYVFSTSTPFEPERLYDKFGAYALLEHGGDIRAAAKELRLEGYGDTVGDVPAVSEFAGLMAQARRELGDRPWNGAEVAESVAEHNKPESTFPPDLLQVPGLIGDLATWINRTSIKPQPILALGASIAAVSCIIGRKARTHTDMRSNLYVMGVAESGAGKERARQAIRQVFHLAGAADRARVNELASDAAIVTEIHRSPSALFMIDETGLFLKLIAERNAASHLQAIKSTLMRVYTDNTGVFYGKSYADAERNIEVDQPCLSIYGTSVPANFYDALTTSNVTEGLLSRFLVFMSEDPDPVPRTVPIASMEPSQGLVDGFAAWEARSVNPDPKGNLDALRPSPMIVPITSRGQAVLDDMESSLRAKRAAMRSAGDNPALYTRVYATALKLALVRACGLSSVAPEITEEDTTWAARLALHLTSGLQVGVGDHVSDTKAEAHAKLVAGVVRKAGKISGTDLVRQTLSLSRSERGDAVATLEESGAILIERVETGKRGRPRREYFWHGF